MSVAGHFSVLDSLFGQKPSIETRWCPQHRYVHHLLSRRFPDKTSIKRDSLVSSTYGEVIVCSQTRDVAKVHAYFVGLTSPNVLNRGCKRFHGLGNLASTKESDDN